MREKKLKANSANIAISRPSAVAISACATPAVTCVGATRPDAADHLERLHHAGDRAEQSHQRRRGDDGLEHPQAAAEDLFDAAGLVAGARFDPPRGLIAIVAITWKKRP